jgi:hypothetical protein
MKPGRPPHAASNPRAGGRDAPRPLSGMRWSESSDDERTDDWFGLAEGLAKPDDCFRILKYLGQIAEEARTSLDRHATYIVAAYLAGAAR